MRRRLGIVAILALTSAMVALVCGIQGLLVPVRVVSGSMADVLPGPHWEVVCQDCRFFFRCGTDCPPVEHATCPNCGNELNPIGHAASKTGRRVLIDRFSNCLRRPRRWEVVVVRRSGKTSRLAVKRVVGLPGECIRIRGGDIYANGKIVRKTFPQQRRTCVLVHDDRFRPTGDGGSPLRWRPTSQTSRWQADSHRFRYSSARPAANRGLTPTVAADRPQEGDLDWLFYHHRSCLPGPSGSQNQTPVTDNYGYNQGLSRDLSEVTDLILSCWVRVSGQGTLAVLAHDGRQTLQVQWDLGRGQVILACGERAVAQADVPDSLRNRSVLMETMFCDQQVQLALDGHTYLAYTYVANDVPLCPTARPLALGAAGLTVEVTGVCVWRDVYYTHPYGTAYDWSLPRPLAADEYFLLGDNSPISVDGRHSATEGLVPRRAVVGRVFPEPRSSYPGT